MSERPGSPSCRARPIARRPPLRRCTGPACPAGWPAGATTDAGSCWVCGSLLLVVAAVVVSAIVGSNYHDKFEGGNSESQQARNLLTERFPTQAGDSAHDRVPHRRLDLRSRGPGPHRGARRGRRRPAARVVVRGPFDEGALGQVSPERPDRLRHRCVFDKVRPRTSPSRPSRQVVDTAEAAAGDGLQVELGGEAISKVVQATPGIERGHRHRWPPSSSCSSPSARSSPWACRSSPPCSASASASRSSAC